MALAEGGAAPSVRGHGGERGCGGAARGGDDEGSGKRWGDSTVVGVPACGGHQLWAEMGRDPASEAEKVGHGSARVWQNMGVLVVGSSRQAASVSAVRGLREARRRLAGRVAPMAVRATFGDVAAGFEHGMAKPMTRYGFLFDFGWWWR
ncbi:pollen-specific leucine-rich repeat extensin-like protein 3 [Iris pallida]|uniref:Pollen-specific leucine-rich repeat extensin-like protein 3 n=1 Tax=Iris pallida TaxID=29817 RepID=A0AAX6H476_IRIPA|nr:pollen-specific leucine-rich repeat extensin-like protein 3 [Iris pallida]